jgi:hypothetical protein
LASASIRLRLAVIAATASSERTTPASSRATATTSSKPTGPIPTVMVIRTVWRAALSAAR